jgi:CBS domain-containing protein
MSYGSARSDYGDLAYGGRSNERGFFDRATDEVASWFGDEEASRRRNMDTRYGDDRSSRSRNESRDFGDTNRYDRSGSYYRNDVSNRNTRGRSLEGARAHEIMTRDVATVRPDNSIVSAARIMRDEDCGALPVVDAYGRAVGMVTDRDIACRIVAEGESIRDARVADAMTSDLYACHANSSLDECMRQMSRHQIRRLPIVDDRDRVVGIISQADLARFAENRGQSAMRRVADVVDDISEPIGDPYR